MDHQQLLDTSYLSIIAIPIIVSLFTWIFSYMITRYRMPGGKESMRIPSFYVPFFCKVLVAAVLFGRLMMNIHSRNDGDDNYGAICKLGVTTIWIHLMLAVITSEIFITTVMVNSIQNIDHYRTNWFIEVFLFITRPILWVYNRLIVICVSFVLLLFGVWCWTITLSICKVVEIRVYRRLVLIHYYYHLIIFYIYLKLVNG